MKNSDTRKEIKKQDLKKSMKEKDILLLLVQETKYSDSIVDISKSASLTNNKICYVTLNRPYKTLAENFNKKKIEVSKFFFIDAVTKSVKDEDDTAQVVYVSSPKALTEINIVMKKVLSVGKVDSTIFDSLSTLLVYAGSADVVRFSHSVISMLRTLGTKGILIALKDDVNTELVKDLNMFVDEVIEMG